MHVSFIIPSTLVMKFAISVNVNINLTDVNKLNMNKTTCNSNIIIMINNGLGIIGDFSVQKI